MKSFLNELGLLIGFSIAILTSLVLILKIIMYFSFKTLEVKTELEDRLQAADYKGEVPGNFQCPVHLGLMDKPKKLNCNHYLDESSEKQLRQKKCPCCRAQIKSSCLDKKLQSDIQLFVENAEKKFQEAKHLDNKKNQKESKQGSFLNSSSSFYRQQVSMEEGDQPLVTSNKPSIQMVAIN